jgi:hypothetical protein
LHPENETRLLSITSTDTAQQTTAILTAIARGSAAGFDFLPWQAFQTWLGGSDNKVVIPFAEELALRIPPAAIRLRRDFTTILTLIKAHALLHQENRERYPDGSIVARREDYRAVRELVADLVAEGAAVGVKPEVRETVELVDQLVKAGRTEVAQVEICRALGLNKWQVSRRVKEAIGAGYLVNHEERPGRPDRLVIGDPMPDEVRILPLPEELRGLA